VPTDFRNPRRQSHGVRTVSARITEMIRAVVPIGSLRQKFGVKGCGAWSVAAA
jgi:hypothetical protein